MATFRVVILSRKVDFLAHHFHPFPPSPSLCQATCSWDGTVKIWDLSLPDSSLTLEGHPDCVYDVSCCPTDSNLLATCGRKGMVILWDLRAQGNSWKTFSTIYLSIYLFILVSTTYVSISLNPSPPPSSQLPGMCYRRAGRKPTALLSPRMALSLPPAMTFVNFISGICPTSRSVIM